MELRPSRTPSGVQTETCTLLTLRTINLAPWLISIFVNDCDLLQLKDKDSDYTQEGNQIGKLKCHLFKLHLSQYCAERKKNCARHHGKFKQMQNSLLALSSTFLQQGMEVERKDTETKPDNYLHLQQEENITYCPQMNQLIFLKFNFCVGRINNYVYVYYKSTIQ